MALNLIQRVNVIVNAVARVNRARLDQQAAAVELCSTAIASIPVAESPIKPIPTAIKIVSEPTDKFFVDGSNDEQARQAGRAHALKNEGWHIDWEWTKGQAVKPGQGFLPVSTVATSEIVRVVVLIDRDEARSIAACLAVNKNGNLVAEVYELNEAKQDWLYHPITHTTRRIQFAEHYAVEGADTSFVAWTKYHILAKMLSQGQVQFVGRNTKEYWRGFKSQRFLAQGGTVEELRAQQASQ